MIWFAVIITTISLIRLAMGPGRVSSSGQSGMLSRNGYGKCCCCCCRSSFVRRSSFVVVVVAIVVASGVAVAIVVAI